ncbi:hypothetical protein PYCC9005_004300 [Savitreella phatthalungensis]
MSSPSSTADSPSNKSTCNVIEALATTDTEHITPLTPSAGSKYLQHQQLQSSVTKSSQQLKDELRALRSADTLLESPTHQLRPRSDDSSRPSLLTASKAHNDTSTNTQAEWKALLGTLPTPQNRLYIDLSSAESSAFASNSNYTGKSSFTRSSQSATVGGSSPSAPSLGPHTPPQLWPDTSPLKALDDNVPYVAPTLRKTLLTGRAQDVASSDHKSARPQSSRWIKIGGIPPSLNQPTLMLALLNDFGPLIGIWRNEAVADETFAGYYDFRSARQAMIQLDAGENKVGVPFPTRFMEFSALPNYITRPCNNMLECNDGIIRIDMSNNQTRAFPSLLQQFCLAHGELASFVVQPDLTACSVEFFDCRAAASSLGRLRAANISCDLKIRTPPITAPSVSYFAPHEEPVTPIRRPANVASAPVALSAAMTGIAQRRPPSAMQRSASHDSPSDGTPSRSATPSSLGVRPTEPANRIGYMDIVRCLDSRTTVMVKNIPNRMTQPEFKDFVDLECAGQYDFLYLRFDFANRCNVGYAFINFLSPISIIQFARARLGVAWNVHASEKIADICYANIQGRDRLVEKFRNSNVMDVDEAYRPRVYKDGREVSFPRPNNMRKKEISAKHAAEMGLFQATTTASKTVSSISLR